MLKELISLRRAVINISSLIDHYKNVGQNLRSETADFIRDVVKNRRLAVLLIPHVTPLNGSDKNSDTKLYDGDIE